MSLPAVPRQSLPSSSLLCSTLRDPAPRLAPSADSCIIRSIPSCQYASVKPSSPPVSIQLSAPALRSKLTVALLWIRCLELSHIHTAPNHFLATARPWKLEPFISKWYSTVLVDSAVGPSRAHSPRPPHSPQLSILRQHTRDLDTFARFRRR